MGMGNRVPPPWWPGELNYDLHYELAMKRARDSMELMKILHTPMTVITNPADDKDDERV